MRNNEQLADLLGQMAFLAELKDENPFKVRALANAGSIIADLPTDISELIATGEIKNIKGIGKGTQAIAKEFLDSGEVQELKDLLKGLPETILELREVRGLGPKKIKALHEDLGIASLTELEYACEENRLLDLKGFGEKTQASILKNLKQLLGNKGKVILPVALQEAEEARDALEKIRGVKRVEPTGALRRHDEIIAALEFVVDADEAALKKAGFVPSSSSDSSKTKDSSSQLDGHFERKGEQGLAVHVYSATSKNFGSRLVESTGPVQFLKNLGDLPAASTEEEIFSRKKRPFLPAECRELGLAPKNLIEESDIKGVFHLHTTWSDGKNTLEEMVEAAQELGYEYLGVSDHSQTAFYARGLDEKRVLAQKKEIEAAQKKFPKVRIFHGVESDILAGGALDYPKAFLKNFDFVIASVHGQMKMGRTEMTKRLCAALRNPATTWLGHWTGRLLLGREGYEFDAEEVLRCAAGEGKSIELNANPYRLDIDWRLLPKAIELGIRIGIHPDAHSAAGLQDTKYGVWMARKGGLTAKQVTNTMNTREMEAWLAKR
jgi:DNA polymerase (family 10)